MELDKAKTLVSKQLRKREPKTLSLIAGELGVHVGQLTRAVRVLVDEGVAVRHDGTPPKYTKA